jgi:hypothetical protein
MGHGGPYGWERLRLPHYLDKRLIDGGKVVSPTRWYISLKYSMAAVNLRYQPAFN